jgi:hypothetical protein
MLSGQKEYYIVPAVILNAREASEHLASLDEKLYNKKCQAKPIWIWLHTNHITSKANIIDRKKCALLHLLMLLSCGG